MSKFLFLKEKCYKVNIPSNIDLKKLNDNYFDFSEFKFLSPIIDGFTFQHRNYPNITLKDFVIQYNLSNEQIYFYASCKNEIVNKLSVKKKFILTLLLEYQKYNCVLISLEALSKSTVTSIIYLCWNIKRATGKTFIFFDFSKVDMKYSKIHINVVEPSWEEIFQKEIGF